MERYGLDVKWNPARDAPGVPQRCARFQAVAPPDARASEFLSSLVVAAAAGERVACVAEGAFVAPTEVARNVATPGIAPAGAGFVVAARGASALASLLEEWQAESIWMAFGGEERIEALEAAVRGPRWWELDRSRAPLEAVSRLGCVIRVALDHASLEAFGDVPAVLRFLDCATRAAKVS
ncbi:hypothetical protein ACOQFB_04205 [Anaeromyxobacter sp. Red801]|uniref:hypothetical protein n=1 Tax=Anaeromyxobacter sp. Red801 TaxID=3411632 RepID=UPI003BA0003B